MKIKLILLLVFAGLLGCHSVQKEGCQKDSDCDKQICVFGKCQECAQDSDCQEMMVCEKNQCHESVAVTSSDAGSTDLTVSDSSCSQTGTAYFDFDVYVLKPEGRDLLTEIATCLRMKSESKITVAGNTDERGTVEYNLALGEKRAKAVSDYLQKSGIDASRMTIISYGKEKPVDEGHNEEAWAKNRRTDITLD